MVFQDFVYPAQITDCETCHKPGTYEVPDSTQFAWTVVDAEPALGTASTFNPRLSVRQGPAAGACGSCHSSAAAQAHFQANTSSSAGAESCAVCHGPGRTYEAHAD
jgi:OmcA/MtrC family decaheme c-type cytochrome